MPKPLGHDVIPPENLLRNRYDWDDWLIPGKEWEFTRERDFPGVDLDMFLQAMRNAAGRTTKKRRAVDYLFERIDEVTIYLWIYEKGHKPKKGHKPQKGQS